MKKIIIIIGLALAGVIHSQAQTNHFTTPHFTPVDPATASSNAVLTAEINLTAAQLNQIFFVAPNSLTLNTNNAAKIPNTVAALSGGALALNSNAPAFFQSSTLQGAIKFLTARSNDNATLERNLALLQAGYATATNQ